MIGSSYSSSCKYLHTNFNLNGKLHDEKASRRFTLKKQHVYWKRKRDGLDSIKP